MNHSTEIFHEKKSHIESLAAHACLNETKTITLKRFLAGGMRNRLLLQSKEIYMT